MHRPALALACLLILACGPANKPTEYILFDFESESTLDLISWKCHTIFSVSEMHAGHGRFALQMALYPSATPGFVQRVPREDWSEYDSVCFDVFNDEDHVLEIGMRIDDQVECPDLTDCCHHYYSVRSGPNTVCIPLDTLTTAGTERKLDLQAIRRLFVFMIRPPAKTVLYLDYVRLTKDR